MNVSQTIPSVIKRLSVWQRCAVVCAVGMASMLQGEPPGVSQASWADYRDPVALLWNRVEAGHVILDRSSEKAFLASLLQELKIPEASQVLVFSKTSLQKALIGPSKPRAIYFNEECYVGWVQGGAIEVVGIDPKAGAQYYLINARLKNGERPVLSTGKDCLGCHAGGGLQVQSVHANWNGYPLASEDRFVTTPESPLSERWGGWYVTGKHGDELHMGNVTTEQTPHGTRLNRERGANVESLKDFISVEPYLTGGSDIVALMVLEHQHVMQNTLADAGRAMRTVLARPQNKAGGVRSPYQNSTPSIIRKQAHKVVKQLLFASEYELQDGGVRGDAAFQKAFQANRRETPEGSSLKDFDLTHHLFKHRCSYMIYSASFEALPAPLKLEIYKCLRDILQGPNVGSEYAYLGADERKQILDILWHTKPEAREVWEALSHADKDAKEALPAGSAGGNTP